ncbi:MAG TPA: MauE/DoxX family redox-associated membrane protein [Longimicrobiales bacterium]
MRTAVRSFVVVVLLVSAASKVYDFPGTSLYFAELFRVGPRGGRALLALVILAELGFAGWIVLSPGRRACSLLLGLFMVFLCTSVWLAVSGRENCGCFGTRLPSSPRAAVLKNLVLVACAGYLWRQAMAGGGAGRLADSGRAPTRRPVATHAGADPPSV